MLFETYYKRSRSPFYSFIFILPLFLIYELGIWMIASKDLPTIRNGADVLLRKILLNLGITGIYGMALALLIGIIIAFFINRGKFSEIKINTNYFMLMIFESLIWSGILFTILRQGQLLLSVGSAKLFFQQIVLSIGSGIFEEFIFRLVLVSGLILILGIFIKKRYWYKIFFAILFSAIIFSSFHFIGEFAEVPSTASFFIRLIAGIVLGYVYVLRGFGIAAYAHSFYNLLVFTQISGST